jgi:hypothetical protein
MTFKLIYKVGNKVVQEWFCHSKSLAYWKKSEMLNSGNFQLGKFTVSQIK